MSETSHLSNIERVSAPALKSDLDKYLSMIEEDKKQTKESIREEKLMAKYGLDD